MLEPRTFDLHAFRTPGWTDAAPKLANAASEQAEITRRRRSNGEGRIQDGSGCGMMEVSTSRISDGSGIGRHSEQHQQVRYYVSNDTTVPHTIRPADSMTVFTQTILISIDVLSRYILQRVVLSWSELLYLRCSQMHQLLVGMQKALDFPCSGSSGLYGTEPLAGLNADGPVCRGCRYRRFGCRVGIVACCGVYCMKTAVR